MASNAVLCSCPHINHTFFSEFFQAVATLSQSGTVLSQVIDHNQERMEVLDICQLWYFFSGLNIFICWFMTIRCETGSKETGLFSFLLDHVHV